MAELIGLALEGLILLMQFLFAVLPIVVEVLVHAVTVVVMIVVMLLSPAYRDRKRMEWEQSPSKKWAELGMCAFALTTLGGLAFWCLRPPQPPPATALLATSHIRWVGIEKDEAGEGHRICYTMEFADGKKHLFHVKVLPNGMPRIIGNNSIKNLEASVKAKIKSIQNKLPGTALPADTQPSHLDMAEHTD